jgi:hypothetical protein
VLTVRRFLARRWAGQVPTGTVLWRDMLGVGTVLNLLASLVALAMASQGLPAGAAVAVHLAPVPYNFFLLAAVLRSRPGGSLARAVALAWVALMMVV